MKGSICIVGDCSTFNREGLRRADVDPKLIDRIRGSDLFIFNLEGPIVSGPMVNKGPIQNPLLKYALQKVNRLQPIVTSSIDLLDVLDLAKTNVACLANNHILDAGPVAITDTIQILKERGFYCLGAGDTIRQAQKPSIVRVNEAKVGLANYNFIGWRKAGLFVNIFGARRRKAGANYAAARVIQKQLSDLAQQVEYSIAVFHIGREMKPALESEYATFLADLPVDLVITHHAHITQTISRSRIFSCGDFIFEYPAHLPESRRGNLIQVIDGIVTEHPLVIRGGLPYLE